MTGVRKDGRDPSVSAHIGRGSRWTRRDSDDGWWSRGRKEVRRTYPSTETFP